MPVAAPAAPCGALPIRALALALAVIVCLALLPGCGAKKGPAGAGGAIQSTERGTFRPYTIAGRTYYPLKSARGYVREGRASWYGPGFHGKKTASGEIYNQYAMTAAHTILPMHTKVRVTNLGNGRSVIVRVNDRGPFVDNRIIDVSLAAAQKLGMIGKGTARVRVESVDGAVATTPPAAKASAEARKEQPAPARKVPAVKGAFFVQAGAFSSRDNAERLARQIRGLGATARVSQTAKGLWRVQAGPWEKLDAANDALWKIRKVSPTAYVVSGDR